MIGRIGTVVPVVGLRQYAHSLKLRLTYAWGSQLRAAAHPVRTNDAVRACSRWVGGTTNHPEAAGVVVGKTASTELSERVKHKAAGQKEQARGGQRPRARAKTASRPNHQLQVQDVCLPLPRSSRDRTPQSSTQRLPHSVSGRFTSILSKNTRVQVQVAVQLGRAAFSSVLRQRSS